MLHFIDLLHRAGIGKISASALPCIGLKVSNGYLPSFGQMLCNFGKLLIDLCYRSLIQGDLLIGKSLRFFNRRIVTGKRRKR